MRRFLMLMAGCLLATAARGCSDAMAALDQHNMYRVRHSVPRLAWDPTVLVSAQVDANTLAGQCSYPTSTYDPELATVPWNVYIGQGTPSCVAATDSWYSYRANYKNTTTPYTTNYLLPSQLLTAQFGKDSPAEGALFFASAWAFAEVVWESSTRLACASAQGAGGCYVVVCYYSPGSTRVDADWVQNVRAASPDVSSGSGSSSLVTLASLCVAVLVALLLAIN